MKRQLIAGVCALLIMPGVFFYQPTIGTHAATSFGGSGFSLTSHIAAQQTEPEAKHKDVPWVPILILSLVVPTAALLVPSFYMAKREDDGKGPPG